jgi:SAM-dependent methyltransferase
LSGAISVRLAKRFMTLREHDPATFLDPVYVRYIQEFTDGKGDPEERRQNLLEMAELRYQGECGVPFSSYFGPHDLAPYLSGKKLLEFGSAHGGMARAIVERFRPASLVGVDIDPDRVAAAQLYFESRRLPGEFVVYGGDILPYPDSEFDTVYTFDVFQHVADVGLSLRECLRVLKPGGTLLAVFPGFYHPFSHYLHLVTGTPAIHCLFGRDTLSRAYEEILDDRGEQARWYRRKKPGFEDWERSFMINGISKARFKRLARGSGFQPVLDYPLPLGQTGRLRRRHPVLRLTVPAFWLLARLPGLHEVFNHRIVTILRRPA